MEHYDVFGMKVSNYFINDLEQLFDQTIHTSENIILYGYSFGIIPLFKRYSDLYSKVNSFDLLVSDGTLFAWFCYLFGFKLKTVMSIPDITNYSLEYANKKHLKVLLFGATKEINNKANKYLSNKYTNIYFQEGIDGYFKESDEKNIIHRINELAPDILLIGISTPIKERFAYKYKQELKASIIIPCGGMIDIFAGKTKQTPPVLKKIGLACPYRVIQEPRRLLLINLWIAWQTFFVLVPLAIYFRFFSRVEFNLIEKYLSKKQ